MDGFPNFSDTHSNLTSPTNAELSLKGLQLFKQLLPFILLLWGFLWIRVHDIADFPLFIDELHHINRAKIVWAFSDLHISTTPSKFLLYYYLGLFGLPDHLPAFIGRTPVAIFSLLGGAGTYALTRYFFSRSAGLLSVLILAFFPFMVFHERLALTDPFTASIVIVTVWWSVISLRKPSRRNALVLGLLIALMLAGKLLAAPVAGVPVAAIFLLSPQRYQRGENPIVQVRRMWLAYRSFLIWTYGVIAGVWAIIMGFYVARGLFLDPENTRAIVDDYIYETPNRTQILSNNLELLEQIGRYYWGPLLVIFMIVALVVLLWQRFRVALFLLAAIIPSWVMLTTTAARPNSRYLSIIGHLWIVLIAGGLAHLGVLMQRRLRTRPIAARVGAWLPTGLILLWIITYSAPYCWNLIKNPISLNMPYTEIRGYFQNLSGYGFEDSLNYTATLPPISEGSDVPVVVIMVRVCEYLHYHIAENTPLKIECASDSSVERYDSINALLNRYQTVYFIQENIPPDPTRQADVRWMDGMMTWVSTFKRPHNGYAVELFVVQKREPISGNIQRQP